MRRRQNHNLRRSSRRGGFTLLELTVVMFIIVSLMALTAGAVLKFMVVQQTSNTRSTLERTQAKLNKAWSAEKDRAYNETIPANIQTFMQPPPTGSGLAGNDTNTVGRTRVIYVKLRMRQAFPMNFFEALNPAPLPPLAPYVQYLGNLGITLATVTSPTYTPQKYESSACLLMALQRASSGSGVDASDLTAGGAAGMAGPGGNIPYLTDAWHEPLYFTRVPAGSAQLNAFPYRNPSAVPTPTLGQLGAVDPLDPQGYLQAANWGTSPAGPVFTALTQQVLASADHSYLLTPMLCSSGQDKILQTDALPNALGNIGCFYGYTFAATNTLLPSTPSTVPPDYGDDLFSVP